MVRKIIICAAVCLLLVSVATATANAADIYDGTISTSLLDIADKIPLKFTDEYVFFRSGQYEYTLVASPDLIYNSGEFSFNTAGQVYVITTNSGTNYNSYYSYSNYSTDYFSLIPSNRLVYSSLGGYPTLTERSDNYETLLFFVICVACICSFIRPVFSYILRNR